jgi:sialate O-acetylesterase
MRRTRLDWAVCSVALALAAGSGFTPAARAEVRLPKVFSSHMVLQQEKPLVIWGWAEPNETVTVALSTGSRQVQANERGEWKCAAPPRWP